MRRAVSLAMGLLVVGACLPREGASGIDLEAPARATKGLGLYETVVIEEPDDLAAGEDSPAIWWIALDGPDLLVVWRTPAGTYDLRFYDVTSPAVQEIGSVELPEFSYSMGNTVALRGGRAAYATNTSVLLFERMGGAWIQTQTIDPPIPEPVIDDIDWPTSVALNSHSVFVGASKNPGIVDGGFAWTGAVYDYPFTEGGVGMPVILEAPGPQLMGGFGYWTVTHGDTTLLVVSDIHTVVGSSVSATYRHDLFERDAGVYQPSWEMSGPHGDWNVGGDPSGLVGIGDNVAVFATRGGFPEFGLRDLRVLRRGTDGNWHETVLRDAASFGLEVTYCLSVDDQTLVLRGRESDEEAAGHIVFVDLASDDLVEIGRVDAPQWPHYQIVQLSGNTLVEYGNPVRVSRVDFTLGASCDDDDDCTQGFCRDGVCCDSACGDGDTTDCLACSVAMGAAVDGTCAPTTGNTCDDGDGCTVSDTCVEGACTGDVFPCEDQNPCTVDGCANDACEHVNVDDDTPCPGGACFDGKCVPAKTVDAGVEPADAGSVVAPSGCSCGTSSPPTDAAAVLAFALAALSALPRGGRSRIRQTNR